MLQYKSIFVDKEARFSFLDAFIRMQEGVSDSMIHHLTK